MIYFDPINITLKAFLVTLNLLKYCTFGLIKRMHLKVDSDLSLLKSRPKLINQLKNRHT